MIDFGFKAEQDIVDQAVRMAETDDWMITHPKNRFPETFVDEFVR
jgi:hypothetical protein